MNPRVSVSDIEAAAQRIEGHVLRTPTIGNHGLSEAIGVPVTTKLESLQVTGSFKARGAVAKLLTLDDEQKKAGVVAVSGGNHGVAVAVMAGVLGIPATIVMPAAAPRRSADIVRGSGATLHLAPDMATAFGAVDEFTTTGLTLIHPFDDPDVLAGQGTVGLELAQDMPAAVTDVLVAVGGGALISGIVVALAEFRPDVRAWGVETVGATAMASALEAGGPVPVPLSSIVSTLSAPSVSQLTYDHVHEAVADIVIVSDDDAVQGAVAMAETGKLWVEPAAGTLLPAARIVAAHVGSGAHVALVVCGANVTLRDIAVRLE